MAPAARSAAPARSRSRLPSRIQIRVGLHTGEIEILDDDIARMSLHIASRINNLPRARRDLTSRTVKDLVVGSGNTFTERGTHTLSGASDDRDLFRRPRTLPDRLSCSPISRRPR